MKHLVYTVALVVCVFSLPVHASSPCKKQSIEQLVEKLAENYEAKTMGKLDADRPYVGTVRIVIEHSLAEHDAPDRFVSKRFSTLASAERWLRKRGTDDLPNRVAKPFERCRNSLCTYDFTSGIVHNTLFLKKISYGMRNGCPYIKTIYLLDGD